MAQKNRRPYQVVSTYAVSAITSGTAVRIVGAYGSEEHARRAIASQLATRPDLVLDVRLRGRRLHEGQQ